MIDAIFKNNLKEILLNGCWDKNSRARWPDGTQALSRFITQVFETYDLSTGEFPIIQLRPVPWKSAIKEILWIYQDQSNSLDMLENKYNIHWWGEWESLDFPGTIGRRYGHTVHKNNLIGRLIKGIKTNPYGRRHIMSLWDIQDLDSSDGLYPCAYETLWAVRDEYLDCTLIQRSSDFLAANNINKVQYIALQMMIASECKLKLGKFSHLVNNLHIYDRHIEIAEKLLEVNLEHKLTPHLELALNKDFYSVSIEDFKISNYYPEKKIWENIKLEIAI